MDAIRAVLKGDEAFISFYFGQRTGFAWAFSKQGPIAFTALPINARAIAETIFKLREALEPDAATLDKIPAFDVTLAHELYSSLLEPVEAGWQKAKSLIVVTNGALGLLPLGLLPVAQRRSNRT